MQGAGTDLTSAFVAARHSKKAQAWMRSLRKGRYAAPRQPSSWLAVAARVPGAAALTALFRRVVPFRGIALVTKREVKVREVRNLFKGIPIVQAPIDDLPTLESVDLRKIRGLRQGPPVAYYK